MIEKDKEKILVFDLSTTGLRPLNDRILGITCKSLDEEKIFSSENEQELLERFWNYVEKNGFNKLVGYCIHSFDIPMLNIRSLKYCITIPPVIKESIDLRKVLFNGMNQHGRLIEFQELLGIRFPQSHFQKRDMFLMWTNPDIYDLREYLLRDVKITWNLLMQARSAGIL